MFFFSSLLRNVGCAGLYFFLPACTLRLALRGQIALCISLVVCDHRTRLYEASARTLVVLGVDRCKYQFNVKNTHSISYGIPGMDLSPSKTGFIVSAHRLTNITLLTLITTL